PRRSGDPGRPELALAVPDRGPLHGRVARRGRVPRDEPAACRRTDGAVHLAVPRVAADAPPERDHREPPAPAGLRGALPDRRRHRPRRHPDRRDPPLVRAAHPRRGPPDRGRIRPAAGGGAPPAAGSDLREDRPDDGQPEARTYGRSGQMSASRSDILPVDWTTEFARLQSDAEPFPWKDAWIVLRS